MNWFQEEKTRSSPVGFGQFLRQKPWAQVHSGLPRCCLDLSDSVREQHRLLLDVKSREDLFLRFSHFWLRGGWHGRQRNRVRDRHSVGPGLQVDLLQLRTLQISDFHPSLGADMVFAQLQQREDNLSDLGLPTVHRTCWCVSFNLRDHPQHQRRPTCWMPGRIRCILMWYVGTDHPDFLPRAGQELNYRHRESHPVRVGAWIATWHQ